MSDSLDSSGAPASGAWPRPESGWPFWWRWVVATNLGWFPGIFIGLAAAELAPEPPTLVRACVAALVAVTLFGGVQAWALRSFLPRPASWWLASIVGWTAGVALARLLIDAGSLALSSIVDAIAVGCIAGFVVGLTQTWVLTSTPSAPLAMGRAAWWPLISALGWGVLFPGAVPGVGLIWLARSRR